jgi:hypothetical protein
VNSFDLAPGYEHVNLDTPFKSQSRFSSIPWSLACEISFRRVKQIIAEVVELVVPDLGAAFSGA